MKRIINGKMYNTETAELIDSHESGYPEDHDYEYEALYQKKTGEFFLYGKGEVASRYRVYYGGNEWGGSSRITPYTESEAKKWLAENGTVDTYCKVFGEPEE